MSVQRSTESAALPLRGVVHVGELPDNRLAGRRFKETLAHLGRERLLRREREVRARRQPAPCCVGPVEPACVGSSLVMMCTEELRACGACTREAACVCGACVRCWSVHCNHLRRELHSVMRIRQGADMRTWHLQLCVRCFLWNAISVMG
jgi:hypothetical protein